MEAIAKIAPVWDRVLPPLLFASISNHSCFQLFFIKIEDRGK